MNNKSALILVDIQNDFCEGGSMGVKGTSELIPVLNGLQQKFGTVIATKDWHPGNHISFAANHEGHAVGQVVTINGIKQALWPDHCVQNSAGAEFHPQLNAQSFEKVFLKGADAGVDSYSAFFDNGKCHSTGLAEYLRKNDVKDVYIAGLVTEYCVKYSVLDALQSGFNVYVVEDGCRGVCLNDGDVTAALNEMRTAGAHIVQSSDIH